MSAQEPDPTPVAEDTIVAVATPRGRAARGVLRLSGGDALKVVATFFRPRPGEPSPARKRRGVSDGVWVLGRSAVPAPVRLLFQRGPRSFTGEDLVEVHVQGAPLLLEVIVDLCRRAGARQAEPGEFTRRAFQNGRLDLTRSEAVQALIRAGDEVERRAALSLLEGGLERRLALVRDRIFGVLVPLEVSLDFTEDEPSPGVPETAVRGLAEAALTLGRLAARSIQGSARRSAFRAVLTGPANAGKSSLFNSLVGREAALVTPLPGTTRDVLSAWLCIAGLDVELLDTAGDDVGEGEDDRVAQKERRRHLREADLVIEVRDGRLPGALETVRREGSLRVVTHLDLMGDEPRFSPGALLVSNMDGRGIDVVREAMAKSLERALKHPSSAWPALNGRHAEAALEAAGAVERALESLRGGAPEELVAADLHGALCALGRIQGEECGEALLDRVFAAFCIGK